MKLGAASDGLADVDLDTLEAGLAAPYFLPRSLCFGRPSKPQSHWLYQSNLCETEDKAAIQFKFTTGKGRDRTEQTILELRIGGGGMGAQTVFPGSTHESGELIAWGESSPIARAEGEDLKQRCARAAAAALIAGHFPSKGARHDAGLPWEVFSFGAGSAVRTSSCSSRPLRSPAASHARKSVRKAVGEAWDEANRPRGKARGFTALAETFGEDVAKCVAKWRGYQSSDADRRALDSEPFYNGRVLSDARDGHLPLFPPLPDAEPYPAGALGTTLSRRQRLSLEKFKSPSRWRRRLSWPPPRSRCDPMAIF